jgi:hypothetical protein
MGLTTHSHPSGMPVPFQMPSNASLALSGSLNGTVNGTRFKDVEEDVIPPGYAVLLMYIMLVSSDTC